MPSERPRPNGEPPLFTDFSYDNLGVPRNAAIPANDDPTYFDLGLCGPFRDDLATARDLCGAFKVPTLRNIALTAPYFHNGRFATLAQALAFYVRRDTNPEEWYSVDVGGAGPQVRRPAAAVRRERQRHRSAIQPEGRRHSRRSLPRRSTTSSRSCKRSPTVSNLIHPLHLFHDAFHD